MRLDEALLSVRQALDADSFEKFSRSLPADWIQQALELTGSVSLRRRKFPAEYALWTVIGMGLLQGTPEERIADTGVRKYYMHRTSHWLGLDVHDAGAYEDADGKPLRLRPGMVLTVEPGLYVPPGSEGVPAELAGVGCRIEDDVVVTADGARLLTRGVPVDPDRLAALVGTGAP